MGHCVTAIQREELYDDDNNTLRGEIFVGYRGEKSL